MKEIPCSWVIYQYKDGHAFCVLYVASSALFKFFINLALFNYLKTAFFLKYGLVNLIKNGNYF